MKVTRFTLTLLMLLSVVTAFCANDTRDADGYPLMYLRGEFNGWRADQQFRFNRQGSTYTLSIPSLNGNFKISGDQWQYNFGAEPGASPEISASTVVSGFRNGPNFNAVELDALEIKFDIDNDNLSSPILISFTVNGQTPSPSGISGTLPVLYINVYTDEAHSAFNDEIISKDLNHKEYFKFSEYWLDLNGCEWMAAEGAASIGSEESPLPLEIKARGNWTMRGFAKKPFKIKLGSKQKMLGLSKNKHFALLAHADDDWGFMRNFTGFNLGHRIELPWTPAQQPVELVINGNYRGLYFLTESIRVDKDRVNIDELADNATDPTIISGGYIVELDNYDEENQIQMPEKSCVPGHYLDMLRITPDTPEEYSDIQRRFITDQFSAMNDLVGENSNNLWAYIDLNDAARYYLVQEIICNTESYHGSTFLFRNRGEGFKWHFSPIWDCGNAFSGHTDMFFYDDDPYGNTWIPSMRANDKFNAMVADTWMWFMTNRYDGIQTDLAEYAAHIAEAAKADWRRWDNVTPPAGGIGVANNSDMTAKLARVLDHLNAKIAWLRPIFGDYLNSGIMPEPAQDDTPAAPLPSYASSGVENITVDANSPAEYFTLEGIRVVAPRPGHIYIRRTPTSTTKIAL